MYTVCSRPARACATTSCDRLIVSEVVRTEGEIVHAALTVGTDSESLEYNVDDALRGEDIAGADGGSRGRIEKTRFRDVNGHGGKAAVVQWDIGVDDAPKSEDYG